ncbi:MAG: hypothetical protein IPO12_16150 [Flavobacteriales bacterium]|nr:hypothetical protein [Flavobacteriales bacterium]
MFDRLSQERIEQIDTQLEKIEAAIVDHIHADPGYASSMCCSLAWMAWDPYWQRTSWHAPKALHALLPPAA